MDKKFFCTANMVKVGHISAWVLFFTMIFYGITGYGMTKGLISPEFSRSLHLSWLGLIGIIAFVVHSSWAIHLLFRRHNIWNIYTKVGMLIFYIVLILFFLWVHFFFGNSKSDTEIKTKIYSQESDTPVKQKIEVEVGVPDVVFTTETIKRYNGKNGEPAYVAVDGLVYDMSDVFKNGVHHGYTPGKDLSQEFHDEHLDSYLEGLEVVGTYE